MGNPNKLPRRSAQADVDAIVGWYCRNRPDPYEHVIEVRLAHDVLKRFAHYDAGTGLWSYRGFTLKRRDP